MIIFDDLRKHCLKWVISIKVVRKSARSKKISGNEPPKISKTLRSFVIQETERISPESSSPPEDSNSGTIDGKATVVTHQPSASSHTDDNVDCTTGSESPTPCSSDRACIDALSPLPTNKSEKYCQGNNDISAVDLCEKVDKIGSPYPTDRGLFNMDPSQVLDNDTRNFILQNGPCQPTIKFPENEHGRHFSKSYYNLKTKSGVPIKRGWLCYSPLLNCAYCETCWLFGDRRNTQNTLNWISGITDWRHLSQKIQRHESSSSHIYAMRDRIRYQSNHTVADYLNKTLEREASRWKQVLRRLFKIILSLCASNNPLRGHEGKISSLRCGNFLREVKLVAEFDPILRELISDESQKIKYLSPLIQNEIVDILSTAVRNEICKEVSQVKYYSIIIDSTTDISKIEQVSLILRYCLFDESNAVRIKESFLGFYELNDRSAAGYQTFVLESLSKLGLEFEFCRGQGYDGASVMSGSSRGLQAKLASLNSKAPYVHCAAHKLNLVLVDGVKSDPSMSDFFQTVQAIYVFFHSSGIRWNELKSFVNQNSDPQKSESICLKSVCETRWEARHAAVLALKCRYVYVLKTLTKIMLMSKKNSEVAEARGLLKRLESFQFITILIFWENVLRPFHILSKKMQQLEMTMDEAIILWNNGIASLENLKTNIFTIKADAVDIAKRWGINPSYVTSRYVKKTRFHDGIGVDTARKSFVSENDLFSCTLIPVLEHLICQMKARFSSTKEIFDIFQFLLPQNFKIWSEKKLSENVAIFCSKYANDVGSELHSEILMLKSCMFDELEKINSIRELLELVIKFNLRDSFPNLTISCILFLTLPVSVASAERSFSKLKLIKSYCRSSIAEERLSGMAVLNIENQRSQCIDIDEMINIFASVKARRCPI